MSDDQFPMTKKLNKENLLYKKELLKRMSFLMGHLNGVSKMIEEDKYCIDIIRQNQAVAAAISKVNEMVLRNHLNSCVKKAVEKGGKSDRKKAFDEILEVFKEQS